jgi:lipid-binding SYLF domain-containing protein
MLLLANITSEVALSKISGQPVLSEVFMDINTKMTVAEIQDSSQYQLVNTSIYRYGYGWSIGGQSGDFTMIFAAAILLLHVFPALIHIAVVTYGGSRSNAWGKLGELLALAMNSAPTSALQEYLCWNRQV